MSRDDSSAPDALRQALRFRHDPDHAPISGQALPDGVTRLLQVACGNAAACAEASRAFAVDRHELQIAARRFVERGLLTPDADHYRVLGVGHDTDDVRLKQHQRLLLRLFHPDRRIGDPLADGHARRINEAYQVLSDPGRRRRYDAARQVSPSVAAAVQPPGVQPARPRGFTGSFRSGQRARRVNPLAARYLPPLILTELGTTALLLLWGLYLRGPGAAPRPVAATTPPSAERVASEYARGELPGLIAFGPDPADTDAVADCPAEPEDETRAALPEFELIDRVADFVAAYERGDVASLTVLSGPALQRNDALIAAYRRLFETTSARVLIISDLRWHIDCREARGQGRYLVKWRQDAGEQRAAGVVHLRFRADGHGPLLSALRGAL